MKNILIALCMLTCSFEAGAQWNPDSLVNTRVSFPKSGYCTFLNNSGQPQKAVRLNNGNVITAWVNVTYKSVYYDSHLDSGYVYIQCLNLKGERCWAPDGIRVNDTTAFARNKYLFLCGDGENAFIMWIAPPAMESGTTTLRLRLQKVDSSGQKLWNDKGVPLEAHPPTKFDGTLQGDIGIRIVADHKGGVIVAYTREDTSTVVQHFDKNGTPLWNDPGRVLKRTSRLLEQTVLHSIASDMAGNAYVLTSDRFVYNPKNPTGIRLCLHRVNYNGFIPFPDTGVLCAINARLYPPEGYSMLMVDEDGSCLMTSGSFVPDTLARNLTGNTYDSLIAQKIDSSGRLLWGINGVSLAKYGFTPYGYERDVSGLTTIVPDTKGGVIVAFHRTDTLLTDYPHFRVTVRVQRISADGALLWGPYGRDICEAKWGWAGGDYPNLGTGDLSAYPALVSDSTGGAFIIWGTKDGWSFMSATIHPASHIRAQHIDAGGNVRWQAGGVSVSSATGDQFTPTAVNDGRGGVVIFWEDTRNGARDIYCTRIAGNGIAYPVELFAFTADVQEEDVRLDWRTATETNNAGFVVERATERSGSWENRGFVVGNGTVTQQQSYHFNDVLETKTLSLPALFYRLRQKDYDGAEHISNVLEVSMAPALFGLGQNFPNPFNPSTTIEFSAPQAGLVTLRVYNVFGSVVGTLVNEELQPGRYGTRWDATGFSSGVYFYRLQAGRFVETRKLTVR